MEYFGNFTNLNSNLSVFSWDNVVFTGNWVGGVSLGRNENTGVQRFFGTIEHTSATAPVWGELIGTIPNYFNPYECPFLVYSTGGRIYSAFVIVKTGEIRAYGSDISKLTTKNEILNFTLSI